GDVAAEGVLDAPRERAGLAGRVDDRAYPGARREVAPDDRGGRATFHRVGLHRDGPAGDLGLLGLLVGVLVVAVLAVVDGGQLGEDGERGVGEELTGLRAQDDVVRTDREVRRHRPRGVEGPGDVGGGDRVARRGGEQQRRGGEPAGRDVDPHRVEALPGVVEATEGGLALRGEGGGGAGGLHLSRRHAEGRAVEGGQDGAGVLGELADRAVRA